GMPRTRTRRCNAARRRSSIQVACTVRDQAGYWLCPVPVREREAVKHRLLPGGIELEHRTTTRGNRRPRNKNKTRRRCKAAIRRSSVQVACTVHDQAGYWLCPVPVREREAVKH